MSFTERTAILVGEAGIEVLAGASVAVYGLGGVGGAAALDLVRAGVGRIVVVDFDEVRESNLNRLCFAYREDLGKPKALAFAERAKAVNPAVLVEALPRFLSGDGAAESVADCGLHLDCIDALNPKVRLLAALSARGAVFASSFGAAGRLDPTRLRMGPARKSQGCPLAREGNRLGRIGVGLEFTAVWSDERPVAPRPRPPGAAEAQSAPGRIRNLLGSGPSVPQVAGHFLASWAISRILQEVRP